MASKGSFTKEQWQDPEFRARMKKRDEELLRRRREEDPWIMKGTWGVVNGLGGREASIPKWRAAHKMADKYLDYMKKTDQAPSHVDVKVVDKMIAPNGRQVMPHTEMVIPETEEEMAIIALREAFLLAIGPTAIPEKIKAVNTVLAYTKTKPEAQHKLRVEKAEDFLDLIAEVKKKPEEEDDDA